MPSQERGHDKKARPRVTVLMTYYGKRDHVEEAVASVLASTFTDLELLVVDDASTDGGLDLVRAFHDPRIRILECAVNTGRAAAANRGFDAALGEYVAVLDADDRMHPDRIRQQVEFMDAHIEVGVLGTPARAFGTKDFVYPTPQDDAAIRSSMLLFLPIMYGTCMLRLATVRSSGVRCDETWKLPGMDYFFLVQLGRYTRFAALPDILTEVRVGTQNMRYGRDLIADRVVRLEAGLRLFDLPSSIDKAKLLAALEGRWKGTPSLWMVFSLRRYINELVRLNLRKEHFPPVLFEQFLESKWKALFHPLAKASLLAGCMHAWLDHPWQPEHFHHLFKRVAGRE